MWFGLSREIKGYQEAKEHYADPYGQRANDVWRQWIHAELGAGRRPPLFAPDALVDEVREEIARRRPGP